jgi:MFS family permease
MLTCVSVFTLGSGICGGAINGSMLIAGRAIQGAGSGGITLLNSGLNTLDLFRDLTDWFTLP